MQSSDLELKKAAAREWNRWDLTIGALYDPPNAYEKLEDDKRCLIHAMLETHYFVHGGFLEEGQLLREENIGRIRHLTVSSSFEYSGWDDPLTSCI